MEDAGQKLKKARDRLGLRVRDVEQASIKIAKKYHNDEFEVLINRISDIENRSLVPSVHKLYSLCAIYRLDFDEVMEWFGIPLRSIASDGSLVELEETHVVAFKHNPETLALFPLSLDPGFDPRRTSFISRLVQRWGKLPLMFFESLDLKDRRYGFIGTEDWFMYPLLQPGSFVEIDDTVRKISSSGWTNEFDRPIYFFEHRKGYACGWCSQPNDQLILQPHPASPCHPQVYPASEMDLVGRVTGVAMRLDQGRRRHSRSEASR